MKCLLRARRGGRCGAQWVVTGSMLGVPTSELGWLAMQFTTGGPTGKPMLPGPPTVLTKGIGGESRRGK